MTFLNRFTIKVMIGWLFSARSSTAHYLRIQAALFGSLHSVIGDGRDWFSGLTRGNADLAICRDSTAKIITYS